MAHGWAKWSKGPEGFGQLLQQIGVPLPELTAWMVIMLVAMFTVHLQYGFSSVNTIGLTKAGPVFGPLGYEVNLLYIAGLLALVMAGGGTWSFDRWLARRREMSERPTTPRAPHK